MIRINKLSILSEKKPILKKINLNIKKGECVALVGGIGSGKSTLLQTISGIIPYGKNFEREGEVLLNGKKVDRIMNKEVFHLFQNPDEQLFCNTVKEEIAFGLKNENAKGVEERVGNALKRLGLENFKDKCPFDLSEGQKQKVMLASMVALEREIILLDEPSSNLDYKTSEEIYLLVKELHEEGKTIIIVEHDTDKIIENIERTILIYEGKKLDDGPSKEVLKKSIMKKAGVKIPWILK
ncbi:ABC transporter ATP-binding protein [Candidatus Micrarchaeota archaeon]|nr:ABC transporter ATP-binding protein [Candidatus Micrarchaeota archaeon]